MSMAMLNMHSQAEKLKRPALAGLAVMKIVRNFWDDYRRSQYLLSTSYHRHPLARGMPRRVWGRHSALFLMMDDAEKDSTQH